MDLEEARIVAHDVHGRLEPACERVAIAGSIRREAIEVGDVELVYIPRMIEEPVNLFETAPAPMTLKLIVGLVKEGYWRFDDQVKRNGPKYKRLIHLTSGVVIELFRAQPENWGLQLVVRTGPALFNKLLVDRMHGAMPIDMKMEGGFLWRRGRRVDTPTERSFFEEVGLPWIGPEERTAGRLWEILRSRRASHSKDDDFTRCVTTRSNGPAHKTGPPTFSE